MSLVIDHDNATISATNGVTIPKLIVGDKLFPVPQTINTFLGMNTRGELEFSIPRIATDPTPILGGDLDVASHTIKSNGNIILKPTGRLVVGEVQYPSTDGVDGQVLTTKGNGETYWSTPKKTKIADDLTPALGGDLSVGIFSIVSSNADINLKPGTGHVTFSGVKLPNTDGTTGQVMVTNGSGALHWATLGGISQIQQDIAPKLGGNLDTNTRKITSSTDVVIQPTGRVVLSGLRYPSTDGVLGQVLATDGQGNLYWSSLAGTAKLSSNLDTNGHAIVSNGDVEIAPSGRLSVIGGFTVSSGNFSSAGDARAGLYVLRGVTTSSRPLELSLDGAGKKLVLPNDTTWAFIVQVAARRSDSDDESASYKIEGCIDNNTTKTALVGSPMTILMAEDNTSWKVDVSADDTNDALSIRVTGEDGKNIRWVAFVHTAEVTG